MLRFALCDDDEGACRELREEICKTPGYRRCADLRISEYRRGEDLLADITEGYERFDLIFLDVHMDGELSGVELARRLRSVRDRSPIVFLSTSPTLGVEVFEVEAAGYLLKPVEQEKLAALLHKVFTPIAYNRVALQFGRGRRYLNLSDIVYAECFSHSVVVHLDSGELVSYSGTLGELTNALTDSRFLRCHQSYLVNMEHVKDVDKDFVMDNGACIPIPVRRQREIADIYYRFFVSAALGSRGGKEDTCV